MDTWKAFHATMSIVRANATATRTLAEQEENRIYTHYEGWLPADADLPTNQWRDAWIGTGLLRDTHPRTILNFEASAGTTGTVPDPPYDPNDPAVKARILARKSQPT